MKEIKVFKILMIIFWALTILCTISRVLPFFGIVNIIMVLMLRFVTIIVPAAIVFTILYLVKRHRLKKKPKH